MNQWKESRRAGRNKNKQNITSHDFEKKILTLLNRGCCVWFDLKRELHTLRPGHVPPTQLMKVIFLLLLCLRTVVWVFLGWAGTFRTKISLRPMPTTTLLIPQTHSSHTCGVVNWRWKKSGSQCCTASHASKSQKNTEKYDIKIFEHNWAASSFFLYFCFFKI